MQLRLATLCCASVIMLACGGRSEEPVATKPTSAKPEAKPASADPAKPAEDTTPKSSASFTGVIEGVVRLAKGAQLPRLEDMKDGSQFVVVAPSAPCSPLTDEDLTPVAMTPTRELRDIHVALTGMSDYPSPTPTNHELYLSDCRLTPRLVGAAVGDTLRITNRSEVPLLPVFSGESFMQAIMPEASRVIKVEKLGATRLGCAFASFCGRTDVLVTAHPLFAVSDAKGHFTIAKIPLDQEVTVHAWHPLFQDSTTTVRLTADEPRRVIELMLSPAPGTAPKPTKKTSEPNKAGKPSKAPKGATAP